MNITLYQLDNMTTLEKRIIPIDLIFDYLSLMSYTLRIKGEKTTKKS